MEMVVHLDNDVFEIVRDGIKDVEVRVNDEKRRKLKVGDTLIFLKRPLDDEEIRTTITFLDYYDNFTELVEHYEMKRLYLESYTKEMWLQEMKRFYSDEEQAKYGVVAIGFSKE